MTGAAAVGRIANPSLKYGRIGNPSYNQTQKLFLGGPCVTVTT
jgi:hypothetical protein